MAQVLRCPVCRAGRLPSLRPCHHLPAILPSSPDGRAEVPHPGHEAHDQGGVGCPAERHPQGGGPGDRTHQVGRAGPRPHSQEEGWGCCCSKQAEDQGKRPLLMRLLRPLLPTGWSRQLRGWKGLEGGSSKSPSWPVMAELPSALISVAREGGQEGGVGVAGRV